MLNKIKQKVKNSLPFLYPIYFEYKNNRMIVNFFKTSFPKRVLICYLTSPFEKGPNLSHTNNIESIEIAKAFRDLGYNCDVVNNNSDRKIDYKSYDLIFGFGKSFERSLLASKKILRIFYGTGKHPRFSNTETIKRGLEVKLKRGDFIVESLRLIEEDYLLQTTTADQLLLIGGPTESITYKKYSDIPIKNINVSFLKIHDFEEIIKNKNFSEARHNFLFFSGGGMIHKGLDLLLEVFSKQEKYHLHICAPIEAESKFKNVYKKELLDNNYIHNHNFIKLDSKEFRSMIEKCAFVILPSCSEAMPTSVVNVIGNGGLIPILPNSASINIGELTIPIKELTVEEIEKSIEFSSKYAPEELREWSKKVGSLVNKNYSIEEYTENIKKSIQETIHENSLRRSFIS